MINFSLFSIMVNKPVDSAMYNRIKKAVIAKNPKHSAYRSGQFVKQYKAAFKKKYGSKEPYTGTKTKKGLSRWMKEEWRTEKGKKTYAEGGVVFRPTKRISKKTPTTFKELSKKQISSAVKEKKRTGSVKKYKK